MEDFELTYEVDHWCKENGFEVISCEGDGSAFGLKIEYYDEKEPLGNAGALFSNRYEAITSYVIKN